MPNSSAQLRTGNISTLATFPRRLPIRANFAILFAKEKVTEGAYRMAELDKKLAKAAPKAL